MQVITVEGESPLVVEAVFVTGRPVVRAEVDIDTAVHLLGTCQVPAVLEVVDTLAGRMDTADTAAGIAEVAVDWPRSQNGRTLP